MSEVILRASQVSKHFYRQQSVWQKIRKVPPATLKAVDGVDFEIREGETVGLVGESGCGKSTFGRSLVGLYELTDGEIDIFNTPVKRARTLEQRRSVQMIFQDPFSSLNPQMTVRSMLKEVLLFHKLEDANSVDARINELMNLVGLPLSALNSHPRQFSGGQRQRIGIARALALKPKILIADEAVSALDVSVQATIVNLLQDLKRDLGLTILFISHNIAIVRQVSDRIAVMYLGRIVEIGETEEIFTNPKHPYTKMLLASIPQMKPGAQLSTDIGEGEIETQAPVQGCKFRNRCRFAFDDCSKIDPALFTISGGKQKAACLLYANSN